MKLPNLSEAHLVPASCLDSGPGVRAEYLPRLESAPTSWAPLSIITPSYNRVEFIEEAIRSVLSQEYPNLEYIVIDGGSTDGTLEILRKYPQVRVISEPDEGVYDAFNKGIRLARGEIVGLLNSDDLYEEGSLIAVSKAFAEDAMLGVVSGGATIFRQGNRERRETVAVFAEFQQTCLSFQNVLFGVPIINARFFRKRAYGAVGLYSTRYRIAADREFLLRVVLAGTRELCLNRILYHYRQHAGSLTISGSDKESATIRREHLSIAEYFLNSGTLPPEARRCLRTWHDQTASSGVWRALRQANLRGAAGHAVRGWRCNAWWPLSFAAFGLARSGKRLFESRDRRRLRNPNG